MNLAEVLAFAKKNELGLVDLKFTDLPGAWHHFTVPISQLSESAAKEGLGFDGSSIRGFQEIHESDLLLVPDLRTAIKDPFSSATLSLTGDVVDPLTQKFYSRDPRNIARKAEAFLESTKIGEKAFFGPEAEFFIFDNIRYGQNEYSGYYHIDSAEGAWNTGQNNSKNLGHKPRHKEGYFPVSPVDSLQEIRNEIVSILISSGITVEAHHHEVATGGQCEIDLRFDTLASMADKLMLYKYIIKNVAVRHEKTATFMPKPLFNDNGSGMHVHQSIWKGGTNLFAGNNYAGLSDTAIHYIGGLLRHAPALTAICNPTTNSFKRLVPGFEAPINLVYSKRNRSAAIRIPSYSENQKAKRVEYRCPDPSANPYLAFSALLMAGIDGIKHKTEPPEPIDKNIYQLPKEEMEKIKKLPASLEEALASLKKDHAFLLEGGVFTKDLIETWIEHKQTVDIPQVGSRPHPWEYHLYFDV